MAQKFKGLADLQSRREDQMTNKPKVNYLTKMVGESPKKKLKIRFMQELDESAALYREDRGIFYGAVEHSAPGPQGYRSTALDSEDEEGRDWADEMHQKYRRMGFGPKENFYINVAVEQLDDEGNKTYVPAVLSRPIASALVTEILKRWTESDGQGITDKTYWLVRTGEKLDTKYSLELETKNPMPEPDVELYDLDKVAVYRVAYKDQPNFYKKNADIEWKFRDLATRDVKASVEKVSKGELKEPISYDDALASVKEAASEFIEAWNDAFRRGGSDSAASNASSSSADDGDGEIQPQARNSRFSAGEGERSSKSRW